MAAHDSQQAAGTPTHLTVTQSTDQRGASALLDESQNISSQAINLSVIECSQLSLYHSCASIHDGSSLSTTPRSSVSYLNSATATSEVEISNISSSEESHYCTPGELLSPCTTPRGADASDVNSLHTHNSMVHELHKFKSTTHSVNQLSNPHIEPSYQDDYSDNTDDSTDGDVPTTLVIVTSIANDYESADLHVDEAGTDDMCHLRVVDVDHHLLTESRPNSSASLTTMSCSSSPTQDEARYPSNSLTDQDAGANDDPIVACFDLSASNHLSLFADSGLVTNSSGNDGCCMSTGYETVEVEELEDDFDVTMYDTTNNQSPSFGSSRISSFHERVSSESLPPSVAAGLALSFQSHHHNGTSFSLASRSSFQSLSITPDLNARCDTSVTDKSDEHSVSIDSSQHHLSRLDSQSTDAQPRTVRFAESSERDQHKPSNVIKQSAPPCQHHVADSYHVYIDAGLTMHGHLYKFARETKYSFQRFAYRVESSFKCIVAPFAKLARRERQVHYEEPYQPIRISPADLFDARMMIPAKYTLSTVGKSHY